MSPEMRLIEGAVEDERDAQIADLQRELRTLRGELAQARGETVAAKRDAAGALGALRRQLNPLYRALQGVFGELDAAGVDDTAAPSAGTSNPRVSAVWDAWKSKLGAGCAKVIGALQIHSDLNTQQLALSTGLHRTTIPKLIYTLNKAGLINKNSGRYSLKALS